MIYHTHESAYACFLFSLDFILQARLICRENDLSTDHCAGLFIIYGDSSASLGRIEFVQPMTTRMKQVGVARMREWQGMNKRMDANRYTRNRNAAKEV